MTVKELAGMLSGREVGNEIGGPVGQWAKDAGLVAVYGYSDDNVEFSGAIDDEVGAYEGTTVYLTPAGVLQEPDCDRDDCPYFAREREKAKTIKAVWHDEGWPLLDVRNGHSPRDLHHHGGRRTVVHRDRVQHEGFGGDGMNLKPCPFCGSHDVAIMREGKSDNNAAYRVVCRHCKTRGPKTWVRPWHDTKFVAQGQAETAWNKRPGRREAS